MNWFMRLVVGLAFAILSPTSTRAAEPTWGEFQTINFGAIAKEGPLDWGKAEFLDALNNGEGWEVLLTSHHGALLWKAKSGPTWEYKTLKMKNSPFSVTGSRDVDAFDLITDRLATEGYSPCAVNTLGEYVLFKRAKDAKPAKPVFLTLLWQEAIKYDATTTERFKAKAFSDVLNRYGGENWDLCVCNLNAFVFQKSAVKWEYKVISVNKSPLTPNLPPDTDDEGAAFSLILQGFADKGWKPCACSPFGHEIVVKRELKVEKKE